MDCKILANYQTYIYCHSGGHTFVYIFTFECSLVRHVALSGGTYLNRRCMCRAWLITWSSNVLLEITQSPVTVVKHCSQSAIFT